MITFSYQARDMSGKIVSGIQDALNEDNAVTSLMSRGLMVLSLQQKSVASKTRKKTWSVKETDLVLCTRQLSTMIEAGISLVQALTALYTSAIRNGRRACATLSVTLQRAFKAAKLFTNQSRNIRAFSTGFS